MMDALGRFSLVWCDTCGKTQPMIFDVRANEKDQDAADIICAECESIIATLHAQSIRQSGATKRDAKASEMAAREIDRLIDPAAPTEEKQRRKRRLVKGPKEFRDLRGKR
jgi:hypothetical protein